MRKIIILAILLLSLASTSWAGHHNTLSIALGTSLGTKSPGGGGGGGWGVTLWGQAPGWGH
jgi:hypothetical protein